MYKIPIILGPTSSGKTLLALELCQKRDAVIISADSRQIYKFMDIGTGKIPVRSSVKIRAPAPTEYGLKKDGVWYLNDTAVYGYDLATPDQNFSGYDYAKYTLNIIAKQKRCVIVGGTGFYIDLITGRRQLDGGASDLRLREELEKETLEDLLLRLQELNADDYEKIDKNNKIRVLRAIERNVSQNVAEPLPHLKDVEFVLFGLDAQREYLYEKVDKWLDEVWQNGLLQETTFLMKKFPDNLKLKGLVYKSAVSFLRNEQSEKEAVQRAKFDLHGYIRRQLTWFRKNPDINWLNVADLSRKQCIMKIEKLWTKTS